jgi:hypothetical protein
MQHRRGLNVALLLLLTGCNGSDGPFRTAWHPEKLASGSTVKVTAFDLVWGAGHGDDDHVMGPDCFKITYVTALSGADIPQRDAEALQAFELVRPVSEQWGLRSAEVAAIPTLEHRGPYDVYEFQQKPDGSWSVIVLFRNGEWNKNAVLTPPG